MFQFEFTSVIVAVDVESSCSLMNPFSEFAVPLFSTRIVALPKKPTIIFDEAVQFDPWPEMRACPFEPDCRAINATAEVTVAPFVILSVPWPNSPTMRSFVFSHCVFGSWTSTVPFAEAR